MLNGATANRGFSIRCVIRPRAVLALERCARVWICAALVVGCSAPGGNGPPTGWDNELRLPEAEDTNPDPHIFETTLVAKIVNLEIVPGKVTPVWTYNGLLPGPLIRVAQGDRLIVHFENQLPEPTTIHWHGVRVPNAMDGVPDLTQPAVQPGGTFDYDFIVKDSGTYWYHPHVDSSEQVGFGLYGPIVVSDPDEPAGLGDELVLVVSDMQLTDEGSQAAADAGGDIATLFGREGDTLLVNGKVNPTLHARAGRRQRWRIINAAKSRYYQLGLAGQKFTRIGGDDGFIATPQVVDTVVVTPAQRADILLDLSMQPNTTLPVEWIPYDRGFGSTEYRPRATIFTIQTTNEAAQPSPALPAIQREIEPIDLSGATPQLLQLTENDQGGQFALGINGIPGSQAQPIMVPFGDTQLWTVQNTIDWAHPFHLHGFFFQVLDVNGTPPSVLEWRDTADVPVGATVRLAVKFDERPGMWMFHCHILDHADAGMMGMVMLHPPE
jgi:FtsP/CotA-like multicopper oxidase with cupredoxin domain